MLLFALLPLLAITDSAAAVYVAIITSVVAPLVVWLTTRQRTKRVEEKVQENKQAAEQAQWNAAVVHEQLEQKIGTPNGKGNVVQMLERLHDKMEDLSTQLHLVDERSIAQGKLVDLHLRQYDRDHPAGTRCGVTEMPWAPPCPNDREAPHAEGVRSTNYRPIREDQT